MINRIIFLVEGKSERVLLYSLIPRLIPEGSNIRFQCLSYEGKTDLLKRAYNKLFAWNYDNMCFVIICDRDRDNCIELKGEFLDIAKKAMNKNVIIRIAIREIESWYLGDIEAIQKALKIKHFNKKLYTNPDKLDKKPSLELSKITNGKYQKVSGSREIGKYITIDETKNSSESYRFFLSKIKQLIKEKTTAGQTV